MILTILADQDDIKGIAEFLKSRYLNHHYYTLREREREREREMLLVNVFLYDG